MPTLFTKNYRDFSVRENGVCIREFHDARLARKCLPGDEVNIECATGCQLVKRCDHPVIAGLIELNSKTKYGFTSKNVPIYLFTPFNESYPPFVAGCSERDTQVNRLALIRFEGIWADTFPRGSLMKLLDVGADEEALYWTYSPWACVNYKGTFPDNVSLDKRVFIDGCFHIDPSGCKDVDDVLSFSSINGRDYVTITIADVSASIDEGSPLDLRAKKISQTLYQEGVSSKPMFPPLMSEGQLSLLRGTKKAGLSLKVCLDDVSLCEWFESAINVSETYDYESIYSNTELVPKLKKMSAVFGLVSDDSHTWIESAMKFYNVTAAKLLKQAGVGVLRSHTGPDVERYSKLDPSLAFLAISAAKYVPANTEETFHWGLDTYAYCHITSPIRRYADLINQRYLKQILFNFTGIPKYVDYELLNTVSKSAKQHDRDLVFVKELKKSSNGSVEGVIAEIRDKDDVRKLSIYVENWKLMIKIKYKKGPEPNTVMSKDETTLINVSIGQSVTINYHANLTARSWKRRIVMKLVR